MSNEILEKINKAKAKYLDPQDQKRIFSWEDQVKRAFLVNSLKEHEGIQIILKKFEEDIKEIDNILIEAKSKDLTDLERDRLIDRKTLYKEFLKFFIDAGVKIKRVEKEMEDSIVD